MTKLSQAEVKSFEMEDFVDIFHGRCFKTKPRYHQYASMLWGLDRDRVAMFHDIGTGKTLAAIYLRRLWKCKKTLIVCPNSVIKTWREQIQEHTSSTFIELTGERDFRRTNAFLGHALLNIINYEGLKVVFGKRVPIKEGAKRKHYVVDYEAIERAGYDCFIADESHHLKNWEAITTHIAHALSQYADKTILLTGTPLEKNVMDLWAQMMVLDGGKTLGRKFGGFLKKYFACKVIQLGKGPKAKFFNDWQPTEKGTEEVLNLVAKTTIRFDATECCDLPPITYQRRYVEMSPEQRKMITEITKGLQLELAEGKSIKKVKNKAIKLAQVSGGYVIHKPDEPAVALAKNPKLDELIDVLQEVGDRKVIIFHTFVAEGRGIEKRLKKEGIQYRSMRGEIEDKDKEFNDFKNDPAIKCLVAHPLSGGEGLNLQEASVIIVYSQVLGGYILRNQCIGRIHRAGQDKHCFVIDLLLTDQGASDTVDQRLYWAAMNQKDLSDAFLEFIRDFGFQSTLKQK